MRAGAPPTDLWGTTTCPRSVGTRSARLLVAVTMAVLLTGGCGVQDGPSSNQARESVRAAGESMRATLGRPGFYDMLSPWESSEKLVPDATCNSGDGGSRWRLAGAATVGDRKNPDGFDDGDGAVAILLGALPDSWDTNLYVGDLDDDPTLVVPATYGAGADTVKTEITVQHAAGGGFTYSLSAGSACIHK